MTAASHSLCLMEDRLATDSTGRRAAAGNAMLYVVEGDVSIGGDGFETRLLANQARHVGGPCTIAPQGGPARLWRWELLKGGGRSAEDAEGADSRLLLAQDIALDGTAHLMRCDRVDFPPGGVAYTHVHPGPGIRVVLFGEITIETGGARHTYRPGEPWFERGPDPVRAPTTEREPTAFIRVTVLPREWLGRNTIRYVEPSEADLPRRQRYFRFVDQFVTA